MAAFDVLLQLKQCHICFCLQFCPGESSPIFTSFSYLHLPPRFCAQTFFCCHFCTMPCSSEVLPRSAQLQHPYQTTENILKLLQLTPASTKSDCTVSSAVPTVMKSDPCHKRHVRHRWCETWSVVDIIKCLLCTHARTGTTRLGLQFTIIFIIDIF